MLCLHSFSLGPVYTSDPIWSACPFLGEPNLALHSFLLSGACKGTCVLLHSPTSNQSGKNKRGSVPLHLALSDRRAVGCKQICGLFTSGCPGCDDSARKQPIICPLHSAVGSTDRSPAEKSRSTPCQMGLISDIFTQYTWEI